LLAAIEFKKVAHFRQVQRTVERTPARPSCAQRIVPSISISADATITTWSPASYLVRPRLLMRAPCWDSSISRPLAALRPSRRSLTGSRVA